jgi:beta-glucanase (GH16 family)
VHITVQRQHVGRRWLVAALVTITAVLAVILVLVTIPSYDDYTFTDEFNGAAGAAPDPNKWTYNLGGGGWGNRELQTYTDSRENSFLDGQGNLVIRATYDGNEYRSARLTTLDSFAQRHGHWEARVKINSQPGLWPAWWMLGDNYPTVGWPRSGEIDMVEDYGFSAIESSVHTRTDVQSAVRTYAGGVGNDSEFHVFRMDWTPAGITFSRDGEQYAQHLWNTPNGPAEPPRPMFMLLNLAVGGKVGNPPPDADFPVEFVIDYVRVWE